MITLVAKLFAPLGKQLDDLQIDNPKLALFLYRVIPGQCPFEREVKLWGYTLVRIPPLCKLNPLYEQVVGLRFRAMCYLVDQCGMTV
ncbi:MAG: Mo-dependent nitrogenase [Oscillatoriales cyanobacterium RM1_1_9]|nr:Mo-dependent nitrogenase [Oscillatoriales cyanobacterium RM1_1_9]